jgi:hypothetical protein
MVDQKEKEKEKEKKKTPAILLSLYVRDSLARVCRPVGLLFSVMLRPPSEVFCYLLVALGPLSAPSFLSQNVSNIEHV